MENVKDAMVFNRSHVYREIEITVSRDGFLESCWEVFGDLGVTFDSL